MITEVDYFVIAELFERVENEEIDSSTALSKLKSYITIQEKENNKKNEKV